MIVDADEYLFLNGEKLSAYVQRFRSFPMGKSIRYFSWIVCRNDSINQPSISVKDAEGFTRGVWDLPTKYLVKKDDVQYLQEHQCRTRRFRFRFPEKKNCRLHHLARQLVRASCAARKQRVVHFSLRSFEEALLESVQWELFQIIARQNVRAHDVLTTKLEIARKLQKSLLEGSLPNRLVVLAKFKQQNKPIEVPVHNEAGAPIDTAYESRLLSDLGFDEGDVIRFYEAYTTFRDAASDGAENESNEYKVATTE